MKSSELHRLIRKDKNWSYSHAEGSHYIYEHVSGRKYPVPFHGSHEVGTGLVKKIFKEMGLKNK